MNIKSITILSVFLLLFSFAMTAAACPPPDCGDCETWNGEECVPYGDCWGGCPSCESCVGCYCQCTSECGCGGKTCSGCRVCSNCSCVDDDDNCTGCKSCVDGSCVDDDDNCTGCKSCVDGSCVDDDDKCPGCQGCSSGVCVDNDDFCVGCYKCLNSICVDDDSKCSGCQSCNYGSCIDDDSKCSFINCKECVNGSCVSKCNPATQVCCDGTCTAKCENTEPTGSCDTSHNEECIGCTVFPYYCSDFTTRVYTGNENHGCSGGCPGDCAQQDDVHCYTEYECEGGTQQGFRVCGVEGDGVACRDFPDLWFCTPCERNPSEIVEEVYVIHRACE